MVNSDRIFMTTVPIVKRLFPSLGKRRKEQFEAAPPVPGQVVFIGDSITEMGLFDALFPELPTLNRGIGYNTTVQVLDRLDSAIDRPRLVSLLVGTNDLHGPRRLRNVDGIADRTGAIVRRIREASPETVVLLNSVMPRTAWLAPRIRILNDLLRGVAEQEGAVYVDSWPILADGSGSLRDEFTIEGLHLTAAGYGAWATVLRPHLVAPLTQH